jgi:hypothetical protein
LLLKKGDTWQESINWPTTGKSASEPVLASSYGSGARPVIDSQGQEGLHVVGPSPESNIAIVGLDFYASKRDPSSGTFSTTSAANTLSGMNWTTNGSNILIEDCRIRFYATDITLAAYGGSYSNISLRRNIITDAYSLNSHSQGAYVEATTNLLLEDNLLDHNGWNETLIASTSVTIATGTPGVVTWPNNLIPTNGGTVVPATSGGGLTAGTLYYVVNQSASTFQLATTSGGSAISITAGVATPQNFQWADAAGNIFNRNVYLLANNSQVTARGNISTNSAAEGAQFRSGGTITNNLFVQNSDGFDLGHLQGDPTITAATATMNVILNSGDITTVPSGQGPRSQGIVVVSASSSGIQINNNIVAHAAGSITNRSGLSLDSTVSGISVTNNIVCDWANPIADSGSGNTTSPNVTQASNCNGLGYPNPNRSVGSYDTTLGGPGTLADYLTRARGLSKDNWNIGLLANAVNTYIRAGFGL